MLMRHRRQAGSLGHRIVSHIFRGVIALVTILQDSRPQGEKAAEQENGS